jgi:peptide deformylase
MQCVSTLTAALSPSVLLASVPSQERLLRQKAQPVTWADIANSDDIRKAARELQTALQDFRDTHGFGRAIAAPQIGHHLRMIALNLGEVWRCLDILAMVRGSRCCVSS